MDSNDEIDYDCETKGVLKEIGYNIDRYLNCGNFSKVYRVVKEDSDECAAVKIININSQEVVVKDKFLDRELDICLKVKHPNIINVFNIIRTEEKVFILMEMVCGDDLCTYIVKNGLLDEIQAFKWFEQQCQAVHYLHNQMMIAHRDIKLCNIMLTDDLEVTKLTDFGFAREVCDETRTPNQLTRSMTFCGTQNYMCPEIVRKVEYQPFKADIWSMGIMLFAMVNNHYPFRYSDDSVQLDEQSDPDHLEQEINSSSMSKHCAHLIKRMLDPDPNTRIVVEEVLKHDWISEKGMCQH